MPVIGISTFSAHVYQSVQMFKTALNWPRLQPLPALDKIGCFCIVNVRVKILVIYT